VAERRRQQYSALPLKLRHLCKAELHLPILPRQRHKNWLILLNLKQFHPSSTSTAEHWNARNSASKLTGIPMANLLYSTGTLAAFRQNSGGILHRTLAQNSDNKLVRILHRKHAIFYSELVEFPRNSDSKPAESWQHSLGELASYTLTVHTLTIHKFLPALQKELLAHSTHKRAICSQNARKKHLPTTRRT